MTNTPKRHTPAHKDRMLLREIKRDKAYERLSDGYRPGWYPSATLNRQGLPHPRTREIERNTRRG